GGAYQLVLHDVRCVQPCSSALVSARKRERRATLSQVSDSLRTTRFFKDVEWVKRDKAASPKSRTYIICKLVRLVIPTSEAYSDGLALAPNRRNSVSCGHVATSLS